jgi:hypothetical protein
VTAFSSGQVFDRNASVDSRILEVFWNMTPAFVPIDVKQSRYVAIRAEADAAPAAGRSLTVFLLFFPFFLASSEKN